MKDLSTLSYGAFRYNSPWTQVVLVGFVAFCSVGMFSAVGGLGAGGTEDVTLSDTANSVLYACFCIGGFFAGSVNNVLGPRLTLCIGASGYPLYVGALWSYQLHGTNWFLILSGAILGFSAALLWAAQGAIMMSYPQEKDKGRSFTVFWAIFQLGTLVGASIALGIEYDSSLPAVSTSVYLAFMIIQLTSLASSWLILPPHKVVRGDGTMVELQASLSVGEELHEFVQLFKDWRMLALFPMFFASNYFYAYQGAITTFLYDGRTRALSSLLTGLGSVLGSMALGFLTDGLPFGRRGRAIMSAAIVFIVICVVWSGGLGFQVQFTRASTTVKGVAVPWDWDVSVSAGPIFLMLCYYFADAMFQGLAYYTMSSITNDSFKLARMAGYYKAVQSAGSAVSFGMDAVATAYLGELLISWLLLIISLPLCILVLRSIRETNYDAEATTYIDGKDTDNSISIGKDESSPVVDEKAL